MSTRTYNFRSRTDNGGIPPSRVPTTVVPRPPALADGTRDPPPHMPSSARNTGSPPLLYSEVVRSRTPSPRRETECNNSVSCFFTIVIHDSHLPCSTHFSPCLPWSRWVSLWLFSFFITPYVPYYSVFSTYKYSTVGLPFLVNSYLFKTVYRVPLVP